VTPLQDNDLLADLKADSAQALHEIFVRYHAKLCIVSFRIVRDHALAKDVAQQVFIKLWEKRNILVITSSLEAYLKRAAFNTALNILEQQKRTQSNLPDRIFVQTIGNDVSQLHEFHELERRAKEAVDKLPTRTRAVFTMIRTEAMSYAEVAAALKISIKAVEKEMMKALRLLREMLKDYLPIALIILAML
jgi:RNA polymerase sigma-70 factor (ECF subfamily)